MSGFLTPFLFVTACGALLTEATLAREGEGHIKVTCLRGVEFTPDMVSITNNMLAPLTGMRFAPDTDDDSAKCEAAE
jgi:hypothetical protein